MSAGTDEDLMQRVQAGDARAFELLYDRHSRRALRVSRGLSHDPELAAEAVQDAFLTMWRNCHLYVQAKGSFRGWAMTVVHNRTIDLMRKQPLNAKRVPLDDELLAVLADRRAGPSESVAMAAETERIRDGLDQLPAAQREAIVLAYYGGLSHGEIAARLSLPLGTVKGRTRMALDRLRLSLAPEYAHAS